MYVRISYRYLLVHCVLVCMYVCVLSHFVCLFQRIHLNMQVSEKEKTRWENEVDILKKSAECPFVVSYYGALVYEVSVLSDKHLYKELPRDH